MVIYKSLSVFAASKEKKQQFIKQEVISTKISIKASFYD
jgi:hypothetical protein